MTEESNALGNGMERYSLVDKDGYDDFNLENHLDMDPPASSELSDSSKQIDPSANEWL